MKISVSKSLTQIRSFYTRQTEKLFVYALGKFAKGKLRRQGGILENKDWLLAGDAKKFGELEFDEIAPWMKVEIPHDIRRGPIWDGRLVNGENPAWTGFRHLKSSDVLERVRLANKIGLRNGALAFASSFVGFLYLSSSVFSLRMPEWPLGVWLFDLPLKIQAQAVTSEILIYVVDMIASIVSLFASSTVTVLLGLCLSAAVGALTTALSSIVAFNQIWVKTKEALTAHLALPTRESRYLFKNRAVERAELMKSYNTVVTGATSRLKDEPFVEIGVATGLMRDKGAPMAPHRGQIMGWDGESIRRHTGVIGETGSGKTRLLRKILKAMFNQNWEKKLGLGRLGAVIMDGKGELPLLIREILPEHRKKDLVVVGTESGARGIDIFESMTPAEIEAIFRILAIQAAGEVKEKKWINGAAMVYKYAAILAHELPGLSRDPLWAGRSYTPDSILGLMSIACEQNLNLEIANRIIAGETSGKNYSVEAVQAARYFTQVWTELAPETRGSYTSNIQDTLGVLLGTKELERKFASGRVTGVDFFDVAKVFEGKILSVALSSSEDGVAGLLIANLIKSRIYTLAQRRIVKAAKASELLTRVAECKVSFNALLKRSLDLTRLRNALASGNTEAAEEFNKLFPASDNTSMSEMQRIVRSEFSSLSEQCVPFSADVRELTLEAPTPEYLANCGEDDRIAAVKNYAAVQAKLAELHRIKNLPSSSSVLFMIDEFQNYATVGEDAATDSSFLAVARSSGVFVMAATQSVQSLYNKIGTIAGDTILNNFVSKIVFPTADPATQDYFIKLAGVGYQGLTYSANFFANFWQILTHFGDEKPALPKVKFWSGLIPDFRSTIGGYNPFKADSAKLDLGAKNDLTSGLVDDRQGPNEYRSRLIAYEEAEQREIQSGSDQPYLDSTDLNQLVGRPFCITSRAGMKFADFLSVDDE